MFKIDHLGMYGQGKIVNWRVIHCSKNYLYYKRKCRRKYRDYDIDTTIEILRYKQIKDYSTKGFIPCLSINKFVVSKETCNIEFRKDSYVLNMKLGSLKCECLSFLSLNLPLIFSKVCTFSLQVRFS